MLDETAQLRLAREGVRHWQTWSGRESAPRGVALYIAGVRDWTQRAADVTGWLESIRTSIFLPYIRHLAGGRRMGLFVGWGDLARGTMGGAEDPETWIWPQADVRASTFLHMRVSELTGGYSWPRPDWEEELFRLDATSDQQPVDVAKLTVRLEETPAFFDAAFQDALVEVLVAGVLALDASWGDLMFDHSAIPMSAHQQVVGQFEIEFLRECDHTARGYQWASVLTQGHIERLGGLERVLAEAPGVETRVIERSGSGSCRAHPAHRRPQVDHGRRPAGAEALPPSHPAGWQPPGLSLRRAPDPLRGRVAEAWGTPTGLLLGVAGRHAAHGPCGNRSTIVPSTGIR